MYTSPAYLLSFFGTEFSLLLIALLANVFVACAVYLYAEKNASRKIFLWYIGIETLLVLLNSAPVSSSFEIFFPITFLRLTMALVVLSVSAFFLFVLSIFSKEEISTFFKKGHILFFVITAAALSLLTLSPFVLSGFIEQDGKWLVEFGKEGPAFGIFLSFCFLGGVYVVAKKFLFSSIEDREQARYLVYGLVGTVLSFFIFGFIEKLFFHTATAGQYTSLYVLPFVFFSSFAMLKFELVNRKIALAQFGAFFLVVFLAFNLFNAGDYSEAIMSTITLAGGTILGVYVIRGTREETIQKHHVETINIELERLNRQKSEFVSFASHQLRSPIVVIKGYAESMLEGSFGKLSARANEAIGKIYDSSRHLMSTIEDFLDFAGVEEGKLSYRFAFADLTSVTEEVLDMLKSKAGEKNIAIIFHKRPKRRVKVFMDTEKIRGVIMNLADNAIKYTPAGGHALVDLIFDEGIGVARLLVEDSGIGIKKEDIGKLFQKFSRMSGKGSAQIGIGIGLYVAQEIVAAHGGRIWAESAGEGKGTKFFIELPLRKP